jgi:hypothetical protein
MKWKQWLENWDMTSLKIKTPFLEMEWSPSDADRSAAWELYIELLTRITTQFLDDTHGTEKAALDSIYSIFPITRNVINKNGRECIAFTKIAIVVLNQIIRPFTAKWHRIASDEGFNQSEKCQEFRSELKHLQIKLRKYTQMLADMAGVEDLTELEDNSLL